MKPKRNPDQVFGAFPEIQGEVIQQELEGIGEHPFTDYGFYRARGRNRAYWFTCCQYLVELNYTGDIYRDDDILRAKHGQASFCPLCGQQIVNICLGRLRISRSGVYKKLHEWRNVVRLDWHDGGVLMEAGTLDCTWWPGDAQFDGWTGEGVLDGVQLPEPEVEWRPFRRYWAAPGEVLAWRTEWMDRHHPAREWRQLKSLRTSTCFPFQSHGLGWTDPEWGQYLAYRLGSVIQSELRWCGFEQFFSLHDTESCYGNLLVSYLLMAAKYPQVELLTKLGYDTVVDQLLRGNRGGWNWRAKNPADFFGMSKADFRAFRRSGMGVEDMKRFRELEGVDFGTFCREGARLRDTGMSLSVVDKLARRVGVSLPRAVSYVLRPGNCAELWRDYLDAAEKLDYDLTREDVAMPRDLRQRHDQAVITVEYNEHRETTEAYQRDLLPQLRAQYAFAWDGLEIIVPEHAGQIVAEGKVLRHCVGGYAPRHMKGVTTILFLRKQEDPDTPYITIEMNGSQLVQAHGYRNEGDGASAPRERHRAFFDLWLKWVQSGSRRLSSGAPDLRRRKEEIA